jgi:hypothetical protein
MKRGKMTTVEIKKLKNVAIKFPEPLRTLILREPDSIGADELIGKLGVWLNLLKMPREREK